jgi:hypothetical protein
VLDAGLWGLFAGSSLLLGAVAGLLLRLPQHVVAAITGFGAGVLISAVAFELTEEAYTVGGADAVALGLAAGALVFFAGARYIDRMGGSDGASRAIAFGAALDAVPESAAIGLSVRRLRESRRLHAGVRGRRRAVHAHRHHAPQGIRGLPGHAAGGADHGAGLRGGFPAQHDVNPSSS